MVRYSPAQVNVGRLALRLGLTGRRSVGRPRQLIVGRREVECSVVRNSSAILRPGHDQSGHLRAFVGMRKSFRQLGLLAPQRVPLLNHLPY